MVHNFQMPTRFAVESINLISRLFILILIWRNLIRIDALQIVRLLMKWIDKYQLIGRFELVDNLKRQYVAVYTIFILIRTIYVAYIVTTSLNSDFRQKIQFWQFDSFESLTNAIELSFNLILYRRAKRVEWLRQWKMRKFRTEPKSVPNWISLTIFWVLLFRWPINNSNNEQNDLN